MRDRFLLAAAVVATLAGCDARAPTDALSAASAPAAAAVPPEPGVAPPQGAAGPQYAEQTPPQVANSDPLYVPPQPVYEDYRPPISQPAPIDVPWAPPPMLVEAPPPPPSPDANWTGGYWVWHERWAWAPGRWERPPRPNYHWVPPYYEHRRDRVVFVDGFWGAPGVSFVRPAPNLVIALAVIGAGIAVGRPPVGPEGSFVPPPPGSRWGLIVPAPPGTAPAVVTSAPPIVAPGMRVVANVSNVRIDNRTNNTTVNNRNTTIVNNITNVTIEAPAAATVNHQAVSVSVPAQAHLAAALPPAVPVRRGASPGPGGSPPPQAVAVAPAPMAQPGTRREAEPLLPGARPLEEGKRPESHPPAATAQPAQKDESHEAGRKPTTAPAPATIAVPVKPEPEHPERNVAPARPVVPGAPHPGEAGKAQPAPRPDARPAEAEAPAHPPAPPAAAKPPPAKAEAKPDAKAEAKPPGAPAQSAAEKAKAEEAQRKAAADEASRRKEQKGEPKPAQ